MTEKIGGGLRYNSGKLRYDLVNPWAHEQMVRVITKGAEKYADRNWELGMKWSTVIASLKRHLTAIEMGEDYDPETGELHAAHIACNAHFLSAYYKLYPQGDDRPHKYLKPLKIGLDIDGVIADFVGHFCTTHNLEGHIPVHWNDPQIRNNFHRFQGDDKFWLEIPKLIEPTDIPFEPHCYITSRSIKKEITQKWLDDNNFPQATLYSIDINHSKVAVAKESGIDIFVDDRYENFVELNNAGICTYLFTTPYNERYNVGHKRIYSLKDLV